MRFGITMTIVFVAGIATGLLMRSGEAVRAQTSERDFGVVITGDKPVRVERVIDGDTIRLENGLHVRCLGVNTPERGRGGKPDEPMAREAFLAAQRHVEGQPVWLVFGRRKTDRYGRLLAHIYWDEADPDADPAAQPRGRRWLSKELVRDGLARVYDFRERRADGSMEPGDWSIARLTEAEATARAAGKGLWGLKRGDAVVEKDPATGKSWAYVASAKSEVFHKADSAAAKRLAADRLVGFATREAAMMSGRRESR